MSQKVLTFRPGEVIIREGERGKGYYVLESGTISLSKQGVKISELSGAGTIFGEMSDILDEPRTCTATAETNVQVSYYPYSLDEIIRQHPDVAKQLVIALAERISTTTDALTQGKLAFLELTRR
ncbi:MAG: cyclic nucleotide-binding domain-containing protein [Bacteroidota bacterium]|nr:cyclic nucleotide-binding domain-containing protein [Candidatus Kapabacteria bacterium]MDW8219275.1 cyclic nucleotide-binding domain-containing protein [Bacteroidota bacterium]